MCSAKISPVRLVLRRLPVLLLWPACSVLVSRSHGASEVINGRSIVLFCTTLYHIVLCSSRLQMALIAKVEEGVPGP